MRSMELGTSNIRTGQSGGPQGSAARSRVKTIDKLAMSRTASLPWGASNIIWSFAHRQSGRELSCQFMACQAEEVLVADEDRSTTCSGKQACQVRSDHDFPCAKNNHWPMQHNDKMPCFCSVRTLQLAHLMAAHSD